MIEFYIKDIKTYLVDIDDVTDTASRQHGEINAMFSALRTKLERAIRRLSKDIATAKGEKSRATENLEHNRVVEAKIRAEIDRIEAEIDKLEKENSKCQRDIASLEEKINAISSATGKSSGGLIDTLRDAKSAKEDTVKQNDKKIAKERKALEQLKRKLEEVKRAISRLKEIISQITAELSALRAAEAAVKEAAGRLGVAAENYDMAFSQARGQLSYAREHTVNALCEAEEIIACFGRMGLDTPSLHFCISSPDILNILSSDISHSAAMTRHHSSDVVYAMNDYRRDLRDNITLDTDRLIREASDYCEDLCFEWETKALELKNAYYRAKNYLDQRLT